jgi:tetratricopeptide (TPR) repeat protein
MKARTLAVLAAVSLAAAAQAAPPESASSARKPAGLPWSLKPKPASGSFQEEYAQARSLERSDKLREARTIYESLAKKFPNRYEVHHRLGVVADGERKHKDAEEFYTEAIRLNPKNGEIFNDLGYCYFLQGKLSKAEKALLKAASLSEKNTRSYNNLGLVYGHQGRYAEALEAFREAGSEAQAHYNLAFVFASQSKVDLAKECFHKALGADPTFSDARRALDSFDRYDRDPDGLWDNSEVVLDGVRFVPYVEGEQAGAQSEVATATSGGSSTGGRGGQEQAQQLITQRMREGNQGARQR